MEGWLGLESSKRHKVAPVLEVTRVELRELENERADVLAESLARPQERRPEKVCVQELRIRLTRANTVARLIRKMFDRDRIRDLERKAKAGTWLLDPRSRAGV